MVVRTMQTEQKHNQSSMYTFPELPNNGRGSDVSYTGATMLKIMKTSTSRVPTMSRMLHADLTALNLH